MFSSSYFLRTRVSFALSVIAKSLLNKLRREYAEIFFSQQRSFFLSRQYQKNDDRSIFVERKVFDRMDYALDEGGYLIKIENAHHS